MHASLGIACFPEQGTTAEALLQRADVAMYVAKSDGIGIAVYAPDQDRHTHRRLTLISELRRGLDENQFALDYQPILHLPTNVISGVEALVRWNHPQRGRVLPDGFIHLAEQTGLIIPLTTIIVETAIREWSSQAPSMPPLTVAVNLSPRTLQDPGLPRRIADMLAVYSAPPSMLALEITENILMSDPARSMDCLTRLHEMGLRIVIDDFGTGYSSLSYLRRLPVDELKIDRSFITALVDGVGRCDRAIDDRSGAQPRAARGRRRRRERRRPGEADAARLRRRAGHLHPRAGAGRRHPRLDRPAEPARPDVIPRRGLTLYFSTGSRISVCGSPRRHGKPASTRRRCATTSGAGCCPSRRGAVPAIANIPPTRCASSASSRRAQELGFSLDEIEELVRLRGVRRGERQQVRAIAERKIADIDQKIAHLAVDARSARPSRRLLPSRHARPTARSSRR